MFTLPDGFKLDQVKACPADTVSSVVFYKEFEGSDEHRPAGRTLHLKAPHTLRVEQNCRKLLSQFGELEAIYRLKEETDPIQTDFKYLHGIISLEDSNHIFAVFKSESSLRSLLGRSAGALPLVASPDGAPLVPFQLALYHERHFSPNAKKLETELKKQLAALHAEDKEAAKVQAQRQAEAEGWQTVKGRSRKARAKGDGRTKAFKAKLAKKHVHLNLYPFQAGDRRAKQLSKEKAVFEETKKAIQLQQARRIFRPM